MELWAGLILGLVGSLHCLGMCGPIALSLPLGKGGLRGPGWFYHLGRTTTYAIMGAAVGIIGWTASLAGAQQWLSLGTGILMLLFLLYPVLSPKWKIGGWMTGVVGKIKSWWPKLYRRGGWKSIFAIGLLNGLLPCGLVYVALAAAATLGGVGYAAGFMALFGVGTTPALASLIWGGNWIGGGLKPKLKTALPLATGVLAVLLILRGLGLGIPYLSPEMGPDGSKCPKCTAQKL